MRIQPICVRTFTQNNLRAQKTTVSNSIAFGNETAKTILFSKSMKIHDYTCEQLGIPKTEPDFGLYGTSAGPHGKVQDGKHYILNHRGDCPAAEHFYAETKDNKIVTIKIYNSREQADEIYQYENNKPYSYTDTNGQKTYFTSDCALN